jgi:hypothetical protein
MHDLKAGVYRHYKGGMYLVLGVARHSETDEKLVAYIPLAVLDKPRIVVRPYDMFFENVLVKGVNKPRFEYMGEMLDSETAKLYDPLSGYTGKDRVDH